MKKIVIGVVLVVVVAAVVVLNIRNARGKAIQVTVATAEKRDLVAKVSGSGRVEARRSVSVTSSVVGKVLELAVAEGDRVEKGELILRIDPGQREALLEQAKAGLARAQAGERLANAERDKARFELDRAQELRANDLASDQDLQAARTAFDVAEARVSSAQEDVHTARAQLDHARYELDRTTIRAEMTGVIVRLSVEEGENVLAGDLYNSGSAIVVIADLSEMEAWVLVDETEVVRTRRGQTAEVTVDAFPDTTLAGTVVEVANSAYNSGRLDSQEAKDFRVRVRLTGVPADVRPGLSARAEIITETREQVVSVPIEALTIRDPEAEASEQRRRRPRRSSNPDDGGSGSKEEEGVFLLEDGVVRFVVVQTGIAGERHFEVLSGVEEGAQVVRGPFNTLRDLHTGDKVKIRSESRDRNGSGRRGAAEPAAEDSGDE
ncbi:MAG: RND transporter [Gemmatimonadota bacterium]|nr:MAG: RND transporter [Gemmatimonadota bacterium]